MMMIYIRISSTFIFVSHKNLVFKWSHITESRKSMTVMNIDWETRARERWGGGGKQQIKNYCLIIRSLRFVTGVTNFYIFFYSMSGSLDSSSCQQLFLCKTRRVLHTILIAVHTNRPSKAVFDVWKEKQTCKLSTFEAYISIKMFDKYFTMPHVLKY